MPKIAIIHDWLPVYGGAERVLEQILAVYPDADLFSLIDLLTPESRHFLKGKPVQTSFLQRYGWVRKRYRLFLPLMPLAIEQFDLSGYDLVISSSYAVAKGVITGPGQLHICYCHSPMRYAWDLQHQYLRETNLQRGLKSWAARFILHYLRQWDLASHQRVDHFVANSRFIRSRIKKTYGREARVIHPPVAVDDFALGGARGKHFVTASRLVPYKMIHVLIEAFRQLPDLELRVIGDGPEAARLKKMAGPNVKLLGQLPFPALREQMQTARAFLFAPMEDFGIVPVEAQACGTPVLAYGRGGTLETVVPGETGLFFAEQTADAVAECVRTFLGVESSFRPEAIRQHALQFSAARFRREFQTEVEMRWAEHFGATAALALGGTSARSEEKISEAPQSESPTEPSLR